MQLHRIRYTPQAAAELARLDPQERARIQAMIHNRLERRPSRPDRHWIRQFRDMAGPAFRLRIGPLRIFYDVRGRTVWILCVAELPRLDPLCGMQRHNRPRRTGEQPRLPAIGGRIVRAMPLTQVKDELSQCLKEARDEPLVITSHGRPVGLLVAFAGEDDWLEYRLRNDRAFLDRIERARRAVLLGRAAVP